MESTANNFGRTAQGLVDKAAGKAHSGIQSAQELVTGAGGALSSKVDDLHKESAPIIRKAARSAGQGYDALSDIADQARDMAVSASESIVNYTKKNPAKALALAAASGVLLYAAIRALRSYRD